MNRSVSNLARIAGPASVAVAVTLAAGAFTPAHATTADPAKRLAKHAVHAAAPLVAGATVPVTALNESTQRAAQGGLTRTTQTLGELGRNATAGVTPKRLATGGARPECPPSEGVTGSLTRDVVEQTPLVGELVNKPADKRTAARKPTDNKPAAKKRAGKKHAVKKRRGGKGTGRCATGATAGRGTVDNLFHGLSAFVHQSAPVLPRADSLVNPQAGTSALGLQGLRTAGAPNPAALPADGLSNLSPGGPSGLFGGLPGLSSGTLPITTQLPLVD